MIIQTKFQFSDRELVEQITENPYLQYFIGLPSYQEKAPFDATCAPANIRYPQDISLLNEAREKLETIIYRFCKSYGLPLPRRYRKRARKDYLAFAKSKKHSAKKIRKALRKQIGYVARDIVKSMESGCQDQSLDDQVPMQKLIKNKNIRIIPIESKWNVLLV